MSITPGRTSETPTFVPDEFGAQGLGQADQRELAGAIAAERREAAASGERRDVDDVTTRRLRLHLLHRGLHHVQRAEQVDVEHALQVGRVEVGDLGGNQHARIVDDDVDAAEAPRGLAEAGADRHGVR